MYYIGLSGFKLGATISVRLQDQKYENKTKHEILG